MYACDKTLDHSFVLPSSFQLFPLRCDRGPWQPCQPLRALKAGFMGVLGWEMGRGDIQEGEQASQGRALGFCSGCSALVSVPWDM